MKTILGFVFGLGIVVMTGLVSAAPDACTLACWGDLVDCRELGGSNCGAQLASCLANCP